MALATPKFFDDYPFAHDRLELELIYSLREHLSDCWQRIAVINTETSRNVPAIEIKSEGLVRTGKEWYYNISVSLCNIHGAESRHAYHIGTFSEHSFLHNVLTWKIKNSQFSPSSVSKVETEAINDRVVNMEIRGRFSANGTSSKIPSVMEMESTETYHHKHIFAIAEDSQKRFFMEWENRAFLPIIKTSAISDSFFHRIFECFSACNNSLSNPRIVFCKINSDNFDEISIPYDFSHASSLEWIHEMITRVHTIYQDRKTSNSDSLHERILLIVDSVFAVIDQDMRISVESADEESLKKEEIYAMLLNLTKADPAYGISTILIDKQEYAGHMQSMFMSETDARLYIGELTRQIASIGDFIPHDVIPEISYLHRYKSIKGLYWDPSDFSASIISVCTSNNESEGTHLIFSDGSYMCMPEEDFIKVGERDEIVSVWNLRDFRDMYVLAEDKNSRTRWVSEFLLEVGKREDRIFYCNHMSDVERKSDHSEHIEFATSFSSIKEAVTKVSDIKNSEHYCEDYDGKYTFLVMDNVIELLSLLKNTSDISLDDIKTLVDISSVLRTLSERVYRGLYEKVKLVFISEICDMKELNNNLTPYLHSRLFIGNPLNCPSEMFIPSSKAEELGQSNALWWEPGASNPVGIYTLGQEKHTKGDMLSE